MTNVEIRPWQLWLAEVRFEDKPEKKNRPVVILSINDTDSVCVVLKVTSKEKPEHLGYKLKQWVMANLDRESTVILRPIFIERSKMIHYIGSLDISDIMEIMNRLN